MTRRLPGRARWEDPPDEPPEEDEDGEPLQWCPRHKRHFYAASRYDCPWCEALLD